MSAEDNVKVAVRVRPFNAREKERSATCIIQMNGKTTTITSPETGEAKSFTFDFSYWSHEPAPNFATQQVVFDDLGIGVLENAWQGYNVSLFAYGQTGSGKSYSMVGYGEDKGIIPCACAELFRRIESNTQADVTYHVQASMMEIYNEKVRDLFNPSNKANEGGGLKVRDNPKTGPYVDGLAMLPVKDFSQIEHLMDEGTKARTVASTQMNATSSRAHTLFTLIMTQTKVDKQAGKAMDKVSKISLVDLAGSERASGTGATGDRLKEGAAINKSLSALGNVISALAEQSGGKKGAFIPYRDSVLTWLLKESLGGNAKTIMIAALSPADINYEETLSTLRYADRAKQIKNAAVVNEDPNQKMIRELKEEVERLRKLAQGQALPVDVESLRGEARREAEAEAARKFAEYEEELAESKKLLAELGKSWEERERDAADIEEERKKSMIELGLALSDSDMAQPQLININQDPTRSGAIIYALKPGTTTVGRPDAPQPQNIKLLGLNMSREHCVIRNDAGMVSIASAGGRTWINGELLQDLLAMQDGGGGGAENGGGGGAVVLQHQDRVRFGNNHLFRFYDPARAQPDDAVIDWEYAQLELATAAGGASLVREISEDESKAAEELRLKMEETERQLAREREEAQAMLARQQEEMDAKNAQIQKLLGDDKAKAQQALEAERAAMLLVQRDLEAELRRRSEEAEALKSAQKRQKRDTEQLHDYLVSMMPLIQEANMVSEELGKDCYFELKMLSQNAIHGQGRMHRNSLQDVHGQHAATTVAVRVVDRLTNSSRIWSRDKFHERIFSIRDYYQRALAEAHAGGDDAAADVHGDIEDPFTDDQAGVILGHAHIYLESLWWLLPVQLSSPVIDYKGKSEGRLTVDIRMLSADGSELSLPDGSPGERMEQFVGKKALLVVEVVEATGLPAHLQDYYVQYLDLYETVHRTRVADNKTSQRRFDFRHETLMDINKDLEEKLLSETLSFQVWGRESAAFQQRPATVATGTRQRKERLLQQREAQLAAREASLAFAGRGVGGQGGGGPDVLALEEEDPDDSGSDSPGFAQIGHYQSGGAVDRLDLSDDDDDDSQDLPGHSVRQGRRASGVRFAPTGADELIQALAKEKAEKDALAAQLESQRKQQEELEAKLKQLQEKPKSRACCVM